MQPNVSDIQAFCNFLSAYLPTDNYTWAFLDSQSNGVIKGLGVFVSDIDSMLAKYNDICGSSSQRTAGSAGDFPTIHITLNQTNDKGRKTKDIDAARVFCVDLDYELSREVLDVWVKDYCIEMIVESSPNKYHLYWHCNPSLRLESWVKVQTALAGFFEGDLNLTSVCKTIRVPGFSRVTKSGDTFMPRIVHLAGDSQRSVSAEFSCPAFLTESVMRQALGLASDRREADALAQKKITNAIKKKLRLAGVTDGLAHNVASATGSVATPAIGRNTTLYTLVKDYCCTYSVQSDEPCSFETALEYGQQVNSSFDSPLDNAEVEECVHSACAGAESIIERKQQRIAEAREQITNCLAEPVCLAERLCLSESTTFNDATFNEVTDMGNGVISNGHYPNTVAVQSESAAYSVGVNSWDDDASNETDSVGNETDSVGNETLDAPEGTVSVDAASLDASSFPSPYTVTNEAGETVSVSDITAALTERLDTFEYNLKHKAIASAWFSDQAIIERVLQRYSAFIVKCDDSVIAFNPHDKVWRTQTADSNSEIRHFCLEVLIEAVNNPDLIYECLTKEGEVSDDKVKKFKAAMLSAAKQASVANAVKHSISLRRVAKSIFDSAPDLFYCSNGVLNLLTGELRDAAPEDYLLAQSSVVYDPAAIAPSFIQFVREVFENNDDPENMVSLLQSIFGYSLGGAINEQKVFIHLGGGSNGKSKLLAALTQLTGDYATFMPPDELTKGKSFGKAFEEFGAKLEGMRVGIIDDLDSEGVWNEAFIKNITSPRIRARGKYEKSREFSNRAKVHLGLNNAPKAAAESHGLLRRLFIIPYNRRFEPIAAVSDAIDSMIERELSGILNWAIAGYKQWKECGIQALPEVTDALDEYKADNFQHEQMIRDLLLPLAPSEQSEESGEFVHDVFDRYATECSLRGQKATFNQTKLTKYVCEMYNLKAKKSWCYEKRTAFNKLQIKFKPLPA